ncbi:MAG TPA: DUF4911 domain-containing protein [Candidatus Cloacimonadota bacterium]|nr:DUF4911 domain-containing protein [Candidatus Cloacimonadota bacterium]
MKLNLLEKKENPDQSNSYYIQIPREEVIFMGLILESLEGWCSYTTLDKKKSILLIEVIKDYKSDFERLLDCIVKHDFINNKK